MLNEVMAQFDEVTGFAKFVERFGEDDGELFQGLVAVFIVNRRRPDPGDGERGFAPAFCGSSVIAFENDAGAGTGDGVEHLCAKLERDPHFDGNEMQGNFADGGVLGHERKGGA